jgi:hypothetical protein
LDSGFDSPLLWCSHPHSVSASVFGGPPSWSSYPSFHRPATHITTYLGIPLSYLCGHICTKWDATSQTRFHDQHLECCRGITGRQNLPGDKIYRETKFIVATSILYTPPIWTACMGHITLMVPSLPILIIFAHNSVTLSDHSTLGHVALPEWLSHRRLEWIIY